MDDAFTTSFDRDQECKTVVPVTSLNQGEYFHHLATVASRPLKKQLETWCYHCVNHLLGCPSLSAKYSICSKAAIKRIMIKRVGYPKVVPCLCGPKVQNAASTTAKIRKKDQIEKMVRFVTTFRLKRALTTREPPTCMATEGGQLTWLVEIWNC